MRVTIPKILSQQGEAGPRGCFFALVEEAGREDEQCSAIQEPSGFVALGLITACGDGKPENGHYDNDADGE